MKAVVASLRPAVGEEPLRLRRPRLLPAAVLARGGDGAGRLRRVLRRCPGPSTCSTTWPTASAIASTPVKRTRPIAAGVLPVGRALGDRGGSSRGGSRAALARSRAPFALAALAYVVLLGAYSAWLKHIVIADVSRRRPRLSGPWPARSPSAWRARHRGGHLRVAHHLHAADRALSGPRQAPPRVHEPGRDGAAATAPSWPSTARVSSTR